MEIGVVAVRRSLTIMSKRWQLRTTIRAREVYVIRQLNRPAQTLCSQCDERVVMLSLYEAVKLSRLSSRTIHHWIDENSVHFTETADGLPQICPSALLARLAKECDR